MVIKRLYPVTLVLLRQSFGFPEKMDIIRQFQSLSWCKPDWCFPSMSKETNELLRQCAELPELELSDDIEEIIKKSKAFPIPFPIETVRLHTLIKRIPEEELRKNITSTYPLIHERVLLLMTHFLIYKREFGSAIEKAFYKDMTIPEFIDRILKKRAVSFIAGEDHYLLLSGESGVDGWENVGTMNQRPPLILNDCLSYDEIKLSAMVYVSGHTCCINDGERQNRGVVSEENVEPNAVIIGVVGPRFERQRRMDYEDILITSQQNTPESGYGEEVTPTTCLNVLKTTYVRNNNSSRHMWRQIWAEFYQVPSYTFEELSPYISYMDKTTEQKYRDRFVTLQDGVTFDNEVYYKRISVIADSVLLEADDRARQIDNRAFVNVIGAGLGVWRVSPHQLDVYVLSWLERVRALLKKDALQHVTDVNFSYIKPSETIQALFKKTGGSSARRIFFESKRHPNGGISIQIEKRPPSTKLTGEHEGKLLVMTYAWDGNAHPGNEFWTGSLSGSGDPAAACSTQVAELHNAHVNAAVSSANARVAGDARLRTLRDYCTAHT